MHVLVTLSGVLFVVRRSGFRIRRRIEGPTV
ncbi:MAG: hypothetical protein QOJ50_879, partial [Cryptosporangiaceae bacterium]|nr:hypothetical protein [Cryptosporangiaceae bacterium]